MAGLADIVVDGETGLAVPPDDVAALRVALGRLVADPELRRRLGDAAAARVGGRFDAATNTRRLVELVADAVHRGGGPS